MFSASNDNALTQRELAARRFLEAIGSRDADDAVDPATLAYCVACGWVVPADGDRYALTLEGRYVLRGPCL